MRAILRTGFDGPEVLVIREILEPEPKDGHAVIAVKASGLNAGAKFIATTRSHGRFPMVEALGAARAEVEGPDLSKRIAEAGKIDAVLDLFGNSPILDSPRHAARGRSRVPSRVAGRPGADRRLQTRWRRWPTAST